MAEHNLISIVIPVKNGEKYLHGLIDSLRALKYPNFEVIIINDASTDSTAEILKEHEDSVISEIVLNPWRFFDIYTGLESKSVNFKPEFLQLFKT